MKQLYSNLRHGELKVLAENADDLWTLSQVIDISDMVSGRTVRKVKLGGSEDRSSNIVKKQIFITVSVEKFELDSMLRVSGKIVDGPEDVSRGVYQSIDVEPGSAITIKKERWPQYQLDKVREACERKPSNILILIMDREEAYFARLKTNGFDVLSHVEGDVPKKANDQKVAKEFYPELVSMLAEYDKRYKPSQIIVASPSFWKEDFVKKLSDTAIKSKVVLATCSSVTMSAINEVISRPEVASALAKERVASEVAIVEDLLMQIARDGLVSYGEKEVDSAVSAGAVRVLLVCDSFLKSKRDSGNFAELDSLMRSVEQHKGAVRIISSEHDAGKKLMGLGGIAALLRYRISA
ncbi:MAG: mRNA surveillance protein pelota [Candidatus Woesearchaeota archaeon]